MIQLSTASFLDEIKRHPEADEPRLIYADWLEEHGDPLGEYIRLECTRQLMTSRQQRREAAMRAAELLRRYRDRWLGFAFPEPIKLEFRRGFVEEASSSDKNFVSYRGSRLLELGTLRRLCIDGYGTTDGLIAELGTSSTDGAVLDHLRIANCRFTIWEIRKLVKLPFTRRLRSLDLSWNRSICRGCIEEIADSEMMKTLQILDISGTTIHRDTIEAIIEEPKMLRLNLLAISRIHQKGFGVYAMKLQECFGYRLALV